jgi:hypothetical protein
LVRSGIETAFFLKDDAEGEYNPTLMSGGRLQTVDWVAEPGLVFRQPLCAWFRI